MDGTHTAATPPIPASGILLLLEKHGDLDCRAAVAETGGPIGPMIQIGRMMFSSDDVIRISRDGWTELTHDADANQLWLAPGAAGRAWLARPERVRRP